VAILVFLRHDLPGRDDLAFLLSLMHLLNQVLPLLQLGALQTVVHEAIGLGGEDPPLGGSHRTVVPPRDLVEFLFAVEQGIFVGNSLGVDLIMEVVGL